MEVMTEEKAGVMEWLAEYKASEIWACWSFVKNNDKEYEPLFNWIVDDIIEKLNKK